ncbi:MAG: hypothetical protein V3W34_16350 [Phycisphaerae bacterium]
MSRAALTFTFLLAAVYTAGHASAGVLYQNDFEDALDPLLEWSSGPTDTTPGTPQHSSDRFLGRFAENDSTTLTLTDLPVHDTITILLDLYVIQTWDGNNNPGPDIWDITVDGSTNLEHTTFTNYEEPENSTFRQAYPDSYPGGDHAARTGAAENNTLGYDSNTETQFKDAVYRLSYTFAHSSPTLELTCSGSGLQTVNDESWGLDNLTVFTGEAIPTVSEWGLVAMTLFLLTAATLVLAHRRRLSRVAG